MAHRKLTIFRRRLFTILSVFSLLLWIAVVALWVRSYWRSDVVELRRIENDLYHISSLWSGCGRLCYSASTRPEPTRRYAVGWLYFGLLPRAPSETADSFLGFGPLVPEHERAFFFPHWFLALLFAILPALYIRTLIRSRKRRRAGLCPICGYDLRATPERCPECGLVVRDVET